MKDLSGQSVGKYHIIDQLGQGGMAVVYKAFDTHLERDVAIKLIRTEEFGVAVIERMLKRFEREAKTLAKLTHPNIVGIIDYGEYDDAPYLVMPYLQGGTLKQFLGKPMPHTDAARLLIPITRALQYAHSHNIVHRDIKPSNILITESGEPMLTDFGVAKILDMQEGQTLTGTGVGIGTPEYMAPEQWTDEISPAVDIYALGVVFYELVTGNKPYTADTPAAVLIKSINNPLPRPTSFVSELPEQVEQFLFKALAKNPKDRFLSMVDFEEALERSVGYTRKELDILKPIIETQSEETDEFATSDTGVTQLEELHEEINPEEPVSSYKYSAINPLDEPIIAESNTKKDRTGLKILLGITVMSLFVFLCAKSADWLGPNAIEAPVVYEQAYTDAPTEAPVVTEAPIYDVGSIILSPLDGMEMVYVPAGDFLMGSPDGVGDEDEHPQHTVYLDAFWIDRTEVTNAMYAECVAEGVCTEPADFSSYTRSSYYGNSTYADYPVVYVDWFQAKAYCEWAGRSLPTEAQWEKAARGVDGETYPWGNSSSDSTLANYDSIINDTTAVGNYTAGASPYGALDMAGNVWEWTVDWYDAAYFSKNIQSNPSGPANGEYRVLRGGSWGDGGDVLRSALRNYCASSDLNLHMGFRCTLLHQ